jgi:integrase
MIFALRRRRKKSSLVELVRWCNGNTAPFGGVIHGSNPCRTAILSNENDGFMDVCTEIAQQTVRLADRRVRFPVTIRHRASNAKIYAPSGKFAYYRVAYTSAGKRWMQTFATYSNAKVAAERIVRELADGSHAALNTNQSRDAIAAFERLNDYFKSTGKHISLNTAVADYLDAIGQLNVPLSTAVKGYLNTVATVKRLDLAAAVKEFVGEREIETQSVNGKRPELSKNYVLNTKLWLGWFEKTFPATVVCDLTKEHLDLFMAGRNHLAAKSRNHLRATVKMFLTWCVKKNYLSTNHRLMDASGMKRQKADNGETDFFRPAELRAMLESATDVMRPIIALQGLAGIRLQEAQRLTWQDVFSVAGHITISATKSKTRSRRLVQVCPALATWLEPNRKLEGPLWTQSRDTYHARFVELRDSLRIPARKNGLRHGFCTYHFALHGNENLTAAQAGNSPSVIHQAYKGLATKADAEKWFALLPSETQQESGVESKD